MATLARDLPRLGLAPIGRDGPGSDAAAPGTGNCSNGAVPSKAELTTQDTSLMTRLPAITGLARS
jgi:hypothetical protein